jgi:drug/metabolite transporter (DMT)-like permease
MPRNPYLLLILTTFFWAGNAVAGKLAIDHISPMVLSLGRWVLAFAVLAPFGWRNLAGDWPLIRKNWMMLAAIGFCGFTIYNVGLYMALLYTTAINASVEQAGMPMLIFLFNYLLFRIAVVPLQLVGAGISILGILLTASHGEPARLLALEVNRGDALILMALAAYSLYTVTLRFRPAIHWRSLMLVFFAAGALTTLPLTALEVAADAHTFPDTRGWAILAYVVVFPSIVSQVFYLKAVEAIGANRAGLFFNLIPIFGSLLSILLLGERFHLYHAVALMLVFGGIALAETAGRRRSA